MLQCYSIKNDKEISSVRNDTAAIKNAHGVLQNKVSIINFLKGVGLQIPIELEGELFNVWSTLPFDI